jgi:hypothetical protein
LPEERRADPVLALFHETHERRRPDGAAALPGGHLARDAEENLGEDELRGGGVVIVFDESGLRAVLYTRMSGWS